MISLGALHKPFYKKGILIGCNARLQNLHWKTLQQVYLFIEQLMQYASRLGYNKKSACCFAHVDLIM